ncbi:MAG: S-layer homology domain-containing protein [Bacillota bacterium]|nr:S-layer homology domain-containing protein [Bacillota bacterium]
MSKKSKVLALVLTSALGLASWQGLHADDTQGHWAQKIIEEMKGKGIISGYEDGTFKPDGALTRAEFVKIINRAFGFTGESDQTFTDVSPEDWFAKEVAIAFANGYLKGFPDGSFQPHAQISRAEVAVIMARILKVDEDPASADQFTDADSIPSWAKGSIGALTKAGYLKGYEDGSFGATKKMTRSESLAAIKDAPRDYAEKQEENTKKEDKKKSNEKKPKDQAKKQDGSRSSGGSSGGSSSGQSEAPADKMIESISLSSDQASGFDLSVEAAEVTVHPVYRPSDSKMQDRGVEWNLTQAGDTVTILRQDDQSITLKALDNGKYELRAALKSNPSITSMASGTVSNQLVGLEGDIGTAGNREITGLDSGKAYVLKTDEQYWSVDANGKIGASFDGEEKAKLFSSNLNGGVNKIRGLSNAKTYRVIDASAASSDIKAKVEAYVSLDLEILTLKNFEAFDSLGQSLYVALTQEIQRLEQKKAGLDQIDPQTDPQLAEKKAALEAKIVDLKNVNETKFTPKKVSFDQKIARLRAELAEKKQEIERELAKITGKVEPAGAIEIVNVIQSNKDAISEEDWNKIANTKKFTELIFDLAKDAEHQNKVLRFSDKGELSLSASADQVTWNLLKEKSGTYESVVSGNSPANAIPAQIHTMRNRGVGTYKVTVSVSYQHLKDRVFESVSKEVKLLQNNLGSLSLDRDFQVIPQPSSEKIRFDWNNGILEWDAIEHATSYDIKAEVAGLSQEGTIGGEFLEPKDLKQPYDNAENEFSKSLLPRPNNRWYDLNDKDSSRVFVAVGLSENKISLDRFVPYIGNFFNPEENYNAQEYRSAFKLWIIPRNENSLYINNQSKFVGNGGYNQEQSNVFIEGFKFSDLMHKFGVIQP